MRSVFVKRFLAVAALTLAVGPPIAFAEPDAFVATLTNGSALRALRAWMSRAIDSTSDPRRAVSSTPPSSIATRRTSSSTRAMIADGPASSIARAFGRPNRPARGVVSTKGSGMGELV